MLLSLQPSIDPLTQEVFIPVIPVVHVIVKEIKKYSIVLLNRKKLTRDEIVKKLVNSCTGIIEWRCCLSTCILTLISLFLFELFFLHICVRDSVY